ncbi:MAG: hypothetical protein M0R46_11535 [Candidatus Muirbacterium halophilum]|nr:hypothetical protein [Candidatus Muirbacterium halophilum]
MRWQPKDLIEKLEKYDAVNRELSDGVKKLNELNTQKDTWYMSQLQSLGQYMKDKHNDNYVFDQLKQHNIQPIGGTEESLTTVDDILDKASKFGLDSLTEDELNILKNSGNNG